MASLISWLAYSGARTSAGAAVASGSAWFYQPGTTATSVSVFSDEDGLVALTQPVALDAGGRATVYADSACRVEVADSTGATVLVTDRSNTIAASQVEIENSIATGTSLTTGQQVTGGRTDLDTFLTNLRASFGTTDGKVLVGGVAQYLTDVLGSSTSLFINVQSSTYGALGNDSNDDTSAISAAINAAMSAGGGVVYFPPGTYKLTSTLTVSSAKVRLMGASPGAVILKQYTSGAFSLTTDVNGTDLVCDGIKFTTGAAGARGLSITGVNNRFNNCAFVVGSTNTFSSIAGTATAFFNNCAFSNAQVNISAFTVAVGANITITGGSVTLTGTSVGANPAFVTGAGTALISTVYVDGTAGGGANVMVGTGTTTFTGCNFQGGSLVLGNQTSVIYEGSNYFGTGTTVGVTFVSGVSTWRDSRILRTSTSAITYTPTPDLYKFHEVVSSGASFQWANPSFSGTSNGVTWELVLRYKNTSGGAITPTFAAGYKASAVSVASGSACGWYLFYETSLGCFVQVGSPVAYVS